MNKRILATTAILLATATAANAETWPRWYIGLGGGLTSQTDSDVSGVGGVTEMTYEHGYSANVALGYRLQPDESLLGNGSLEVEYSHKSQDVDNLNGEIRADIVSVNYIEHFGSGPSLTPYLGAGLGYGTIDVDTPTVTDDDQVFTYQFLGGIGYQPETMPRTRLKLGYRYLGTFSDPGVSTGDYEYDNHAFEAGAEFHF